MVNCAFIFHLTTCWRMVEFVCHLTPCIRMVYFLHHAYIWSNLLYFWHHAYVWSICFIFDTMFMYGRFAIYLRTMLTYLNMYDQLLLVFLLILLLYVNLCLDELSIFLWYHSDIWSIMFLFFFDTILKLLIYPSINGLAISIKKKLVNLKEFFLSFPSFQELIE